MAWVTPEKALTYTGKEMTPEELDLASFVLTPYAGRTEDEPLEAITPRDRTWLGMATAFQALWMRGKSGLLEYRESHTSSSADGVSTQREADSQIMLAPMASRCLRNLSWIGNTSTTPATSLPKGSFLSEEADARHSWAPLDIA